MHQQDEITKIVKRGTKFFGEERRRKTHFIKEEKLWPKSLCSWCRSLLLCYKEAISEESSSHWMFDREQEDTTKLTEKLGKVTWEVGNKAFCCLTWQKQNVQEGGGYLYYIPTQVPILNMERRRLTEKDFFVICFYDTSRVLLNSTQLWYWIQFESSFILSYCYSLAIISNGDQGWWYSYNCSWFSRMIISGKG